MPSPGPVCHRPAVRLSLPTALVATHVVFGAFACSGDDTRTSGPGTTGGNADATVTADSGDAVDAGATPVDAGTATDAGAPADTGATPDAGTAPDAMAAMDAALQPDSGGAACTYPTGGTASPTVDQILFPYVWATALDVQRNSFRLDMTEVFCGTDADIDWTAFDYLLFMSVPEW